MVGDCVCACEKMPECLEPVRVLQQLSSLHGRYIAEHLLATLEEKGGAGRGQQGVNWGQLFDVCFSQTHSYHPSQPGPAEVKGQGSPAAREGEKLGVKVAFMSVRRRRARK